MRVCLTTPNTIALLALSFVMQETHELAHTSVGRAICGCWGGRNFNVCGLRSRVSGSVQPSWPAAPAALETRWPAEIEVSAVRMSTGFAAAGRFTLSISLALVAAACVGGNRAGFTEPPADSYQQGTYQLTVGEGSIAVAGATVSPEFFTIAGVQPMLGRTFTASDRPSSDVIVLSHQLWTERFDSAPAVIGREITVDERPRRVVGVMPSGFSYPASTQVWMSEPSAGSS